MYKYLKVKLKLFVNICYLCLPIHFSIKINENFYYNSFFFILMIVSHIWRYEWNRLSIIYNIVPTPTRRKNYDMIIIKLKG